MPGIDLNMPITLVVKAPNQKIADQTVECALGWTIRKLKDHLASIYPNKPEQHKQKLIYSGKLLNDHLMLKDVLRQYEEHSTHTVHLVCLANGNSSSNHVNGTSSESSDTSPHAPSSSDTSPHAPSSSDSTPHVSNDGLRHRETQSQSQSYSNQIPGANPHVAMPNHPVNAFGAYAGMMNPQQLYWMQHMYAHQMTQYMQMHYLHQGMQNIPVPASTREQPAAAAAPVNQPANPAPANNRQANPNIVMNAQGGAVMEDEDEGNQDWLDWFYTLCRFAVLMSIVYFYSSITRAILGFVFFVVMYLYQIGWFRLQRVEHRVIIEEQVIDQEGVNAQDQEDVDVMQPSEQGNPEESGIGDDESDSSSSTDSTSRAPEHTPGALEVMGTFVKTFFTSLMPAQPPVVNAN